MFDNIQSLEEFYGTETHQESNERKIQDYENLFKIKKLITDFSFLRFSDMTDLKKRKYNCSKKCYGKFQESFLNNPKFSNQKDTLTDNLSECCNKCKLPLQDVKKHISNVVKLSEFKMIGCTKKCQNMFFNLIEDAGEEDFQTANLYKSKCLWICYNKLDRRYRDYWLGHKNDIIQRHERRNLDF